MQNNAVRYLYCSTNSDPAVGFLLAPDMGLSVERNRVLNRSGRRW